MLLAFEGVPRPVRIDSAEDAPSAFNSVFRFWPRTTIFGDAEADPQIRIAPEGDGFRLEAPWLGEGLYYRNAVNLACGLAVHLNHAMLLDRPDFICLHGAGIEIGGRLAVFPNAYHAGKSLLTVSLAAAGARVFSDDILPIDRNSCHGVALGVSPRLRLPVPNAAGMRSLHFIDSHSGATNEQYLYVELPELLQARFGEQSPFAGFVLLDRHDAMPASLEPVSDGEALKQLVLRNFARQIPAAASLDYLHGLVAAGACYRLTYSNNDEAADLLMTRFLDGDMLARDVAKKSATEMVAHPSEPRAADSGAHLGRSPGIGERFIDDSLFLTDATGESIYHLNPVGAGVWRLLDGNCSLLDAKSVLRQAFPEIAADQIDRDTDRLVQDLIDQGLLLQPEAAEYE